MGKHHQSISETDKVSPSSLPVSSKEVKCIGSSSPSVDSVDGPSIAIVAVKQVLLTSEPKVKVNETKTKLSVESKPATANGDVISDNRHTATITIETPNLAQNSISNERTKRIDQGTEGKFPKSRLNTYFIFV